MKRLMAFIAINLLLYCSLFAQATEKVDSAKVVRDAQIKDGINALVSYVSKYGMPSDSARDSLVTSGHKTWADVLDKSINMFSSAVKEIAQTIEQAAPVVFGIMVRQQYAKAIAAVIVPLGFLIFVIFFYRFVNKKWQPASDEAVEEKIDSDLGSAWFWRIAITKFLPLVGGIFAGGFLISGIQEAMLYGMNPYYYAIRDILTLLLGSSHGM